MPWGNPARTSSAGLRRLDRATGEGPLTPYPTPLTLAHAAPNAELLAVRQGKLEAVGAHHATAANLFGFTRRGTAFREEEVRIDAEAVGLVLPAALARVVGRS
jgi:hypothetical protein